MVSNYTMEKDFYIKQMKSSDELCYAHALTLDEQYYSLMSHDEKNTLNKAIEYWEQNEAFDDEENLKDQVIELFDKYYKSSIDI